MDQVPHKPFVLIGFLMASVSFAPSASANEATGSLSSWLARGYRLVPVSRGAVRRALGVNPEPAPAHALPWPVEFRDAGRSIGNSMVEYQPFGSPYYHGGCDLRIATRAAVHTPVEGWLEAGHYGYVNHPDGSMDKVWKPWPQTGNATYFEVAIVTDDGFRYEFHHMDRRSLPAEIVAKLDRAAAGGPIAARGRVEAGTWLGNAIAWPGPQDYDHIHYNIISPDGIRMNPEHYSTALADGRAPEVRSLLAVGASGEITEFGRGEFTRAPAKFIIAANDRLDEGVYDHPPVYVNLRFSGGSESGWDFRKQLTGPDGEFPPLWNFFVDQIRAPNGTRYRTDGGYGTGLSVIQVAVPAGASGDFTLEVGDQAGNSARFAGKIAP